MARYVRPIVNFKFKKLRYLDQVGLFFIVGMFAFVAIQAPWAWVLDRYLLPALAMGAIFVGIEINSITVFLRKNRLLSTIWKTFLVVYLFVFSIYSVLTIYQQMVRQKHSTTNIYDILNTVSQITPKDGKVYFNFKNNDATYEPLFESDLHLKLFFGRNDIKVDFLENLPAGERGYLVVSGTPLGSFKYLDDSVLKVNKNLKSKKMYGNEDKYIVLSDFKTVVKQSAKKLYLLLFKHEKINGSGIYTDYLLKDSWIIYYY